MHCEIPYRPNPKNPRNPLNPHIQNADIFNIHRSPFERPSSLTHDGS
jgi:hypothetical protein